MREKRFKHLVNLYLDGELSASEENELAREIAANPQRKAAFLEYRKLHGATQSFLCRTNPTACGFTEAVRRSRRKLFTALSPVAAAAIAAGVAVVFLSQHESRHAVNGNIGLNNNNFSNQVSPESGQIATSAPVILEVVASVAMPRNRHTEPLSEPIVMREEKPGQKLFATFVPYYLATQHNQAHLHTSISTSPASVNIGSLSEENTSPDASSIWHQWSGSSDLPSVSGKLGDFQATLVSY